MWYCDTNLVLGYILLYIIYLSGINVHSSVEGRVCTCSVFCKHNLFNQDEKQL